MNADYVIQPKLPQIQKCFGSLQKFLKFRKFFALTLLLAACEDYAGLKKLPPQLLKIEQKQTSEAGRATFLVKHVYVKRDKIYEDGAPTTIGFAEVWDAATLRWGFRRRNDPANIYWVQKHKGYDALEGETFAQTVRDERKAEFSVSRLPIPLLQEDESNLEVYALFDFKGFEVEGTLTLPQGFRSKIMQLTELSGQVRSGGGNSKAEVGASVFYIHKESGGIYHGFTDDEGNYRVQIPEDGAFFRVVLQKDMHPFTDPSWAHKYQSARKSLIGLDINIQPLASGQKIVRGEALYDISAGRLNKNISTNGSPLRGYTMDTQNTEALPRAFLLFYQRYAEKVYFIESDTEGQFRLKLPTAALQSGLIHYAAEKHGYVSSSSFAVLGKGTSPEFALKTVGFVPWSEKIDDLAPIDPNADKIPLGAVQNLRVGEQGKSTIEVLWDDVENSVGYEISWSTDKNFANFKTARMSRRVEKPQKSSISRLVANTRYFVRLKALAKRGHSAWEDGPPSLPIAAKTDRATLNAPANITLKVAGGSSMELTWDAVNNNSGYRIFWSNALDSAGALDNSSANAGSADAAAGSASHTVNGLSAQTKYYFTLVSLGRGDYRDSAPSQVLNATTGKTSISSPANLQMVRKTSKTIGLSWRTVNRSRGYEVSWGTSRSADDSTTTTTGQNATSHTIGLA